MDLYCLDLDAECVTVDTFRDTLIWKLRVRFKARQFLEAEKQARLSRDVDIVSEFDSTNVIINMRRRYSIEFKQSFHMGFQNYLDGEWQVARRLLTEARHMVQGMDDGPSTALLKFMSYPHLYEAPDDWFGVREL
jgi:hypothetical protein